MNPRLYAIARLAGVNALSRGITRGSLRILGYHGLWTTPGHAFGDKLFMSPEQFASRMQWLARSRYPVIGLDEAVERLARDTLPDCAVVITIDDGWSSTYTHMLPVLEALALPATLYVSTSAVESQAPVLNVVARYLVEASPLDALACPQMQIDSVPIATPDARALAVETVNGKLSALTQAEQLAALRALSACAEIPIEAWMDSRQFCYLTGGELQDADRRGLDLQLHTHTHVMEREPGALTAQLEQNRRVLTRATDRPFHHFCYPSGDHVPGDERELRAFGIKSATLVAQGLNPPGTNPLRLRRLLDGRSVGQAQFEAFLSGTTDLVSRARPRLAA